MSEISCTAITARMEQIVVSVVAFLDVRGSQLRFDGYDSLIPTAATGFGTATAIDTVGNQNIGNLRLHSTDGGFQILHVLPGLPGSHHTQTLTGSVDKLLGIRLTREIHRGILGQLISVRASPVGALSFNEALPLVPGEMSGNPGSDILPNPLDADRANGAMLGDQNGFFESRGRFLTQLVLTDRGTAVVDNLLPVALNF